MAHLSDTDNYLQKTSLMLPSDAEAYPGLTAQLLRLLAVLWHIRVIPSTRNCEGRDELFCAAPKLPLKKLAEAYDWKYFKAESSEELEETYIPFLALKHKAILEIKADENLSAQILIDYMKRK